MIRVVNYVQLSSLTYLQLLHFLNKVSRTGSVLLVLVVRLVVAGNVQVDGCS